MEWLSLIGPLERLGHRTVEVLDKRQHLGPQIVDGAEAATAQELARHDAQPDLHLVHPRRVLGRVVEHDRVSWGTQERGARSSGAQQDTTGLGGKVVREATLF